MDHIRKTIKTEGKYIFQQPAKCAECGFMFTSREDFSKPSRCPECKSTWIEEARYKIGQ